MPEDPSRPKRAKPPHQDLSNVFDNLPDREKKLILRDVRGVYIYARSAAQRALRRISAPEHPESDAVFESIWWIGACDGYLYTVLGSRWKEYKESQPWADLVNGILWARNQTSHDPLAMVPLFDWEIADGLTDRSPGWIWARHDQIPVASAGRENRDFAAAYGRAVEGRPMIDTIAEAVEAIRSVNVDSVLEFDPPTD